MADRDRAATGLVLRTGRLTEKGSVAKQEGVDVKLAVDAVRFAYQGLPAPPCPR